MGGDLRSSRLARGRAMKPDRRKRKPSDPAPFSASNPADVGPDTEAQMIGHEMVHPKGAPPNVRHKRRIDYLATLVKAGRINGTHEAVAKKALDLLMATQTGRGAPIREYVDGRSDPTMAVVIRVDVQSKYAEAVRKIPMGPLRDMFKRVIEDGLPIVDEDKRGGTDYETAARQFRAALECLPL